MSSKIGDYVHLRLTNYIYGIPVLDPQYSDSSKEMNIDKANSIIMNNYKALRSQISTIGNPIIAHHVQNYLNKIFSADTKSPNEFLKMRNDIVEKVGEQLSLSTDVINEILKYSGNIELNQFATNENLQAAIQKRQDEVQKIKNDLKSLRAYITNENSTRTGIQRNIIKELQMSNIESIITLMKDLENTDLKIVKKINNVLRNTKGKIEQPMKVEVIQKNYSVLGKKNINTKIISTGENQKEYVLIEVEGEKYKLTLDYINATIKILNAFLHCLAITKKQIGDVAEYSLGTLATILNEENTQDFIESYIFGQQDSNPVIMQSLFAGNMTLQFLKEKKSAKGKSLYETAHRFLNGVSSDIYINTTASQDKMDVYFSSGTVKKILENEMPNSTILPESMNLSVKNYKAFGKYGAATKGVKGVSGTSFLYLIQHLPVDFLNHWINLTIGHKDLNGSIEYAKTNYNTKVMNIHYLMKVYLIVIGAVGGTLKLLNLGIQYNQQANYLVWNNRNTGMWNVYAMSTLLKQLFTSTSSKLSPYVTGYDKFENGTGWVTSFAPSLSDRLTQILKILDTSISTHIPPPEKYI